LLIPATASFLEMVGKYDTNLLAIINAMHDENALEITKLTSHELKIPSAITRATSGQFNLVGFTRTWSIPRFSPVKTVWPSRLYCADSHAK
jgi:hypothetical protein